MTPGQDTTGEGEQIVFGTDLPLEACHDIMHALPDEWTEPERWLMASKWFDYRFMHPVHATYLFTDAYRRVYRQMYASTYDRAKADYVKGIKAEDPFDLAKRNTDRAGLWKARQMADGLCMPYDLYIGIAMTWSLRKCRKEYLPRPTHLYNFDLLTAVSDTWKDRQSGILYVAKDERFKNERYQASPIQDAHHEWLLEQVSKRSNIVYALKGLIFDEQVLPAEKARARWGDVVMSRIDDVR